MDSATGGWVAVRAPTRVALWLPLCRRPPPGLRRAGFRGKLEARSHPGQMGYPASMDAGASFEYSIKGYQSATLAFQSCDSQKSLPGGQAPRGTGADENKLAQRAKVGSCAACARFTHSGAPLSCESRSFDPQMASGFSSRRSLALRVVGVWRPALTTRIMGTPFDSGQGS